MPPPLEGVGEANALASLLAREMPDAGLVGPGGTVLLPAAMGLLPDVAALEVLEAWRRLARAVPGRSILEVGMGSAEDGFLVGWWGRALAGRPSREILFAMTSVSELPRVMNETAAPTGGSLLPRIGPELLEGSPPLRSMPL